MVCYDGYVLSHTVMPVCVPSQEAVDGFLPPRAPETLLDPDCPRNLNQVTLADPRPNEKGQLCHGYMELRYLLQEALEGARAVIALVDEEFGAAFGRRWGGLCWGHRLEDAEVVLVAAGSLASGACASADTLRSQGIAAGVLGVRSYRPFPGQELANALRGARVAAVFDKSLSYGHEGPICSDLKSALHSAGGGPAVHGYIAGLGGRDVNASELAQAAAHSLEWVRAGKGPKPTEWINCRIDA